jgi:DNA-binding GntR family transcriptional regulator
VCQSLVNSRVETMSSNSGRKNTVMQKTKKDAMVELLRDAILSGELQPGERLLQEDLAERFKVSPTPIREAIQQLVAEGVLSHSPYKSVQVAEVRQEEVREVYLIRSVVERLAVREGVSNLKISDVKRLHTLQDEITALVQGGQHGSLIKLNRDFHMLIYEAAGMPQLLQMIKTLWIKSPWDTLFVVPNRAEMIVQEHQRILAAIDQGDAELAGLHMQEHIEHGVQMLVEYLKGAE